MPRYLQWLLAVVAILAIGGFVIYDRSRTLEEQIHSASSVTFIGEAPVTDGGSYTFFFLLPRRHQMALKVRHRRPDMGGNANFQEIWLDSSGGMNPHLDLQPGSQLESKILTLLESATCKANAREDFMTPPTQERLRWVVERIRDRKSVW